jgi:hypothetical protein
MSGLVIDDLNSKLGVFFIDGDKQAAQVPQPRRPLSYYTIVLLPSERFVKLVTDPSA